MQLACACATLTHRRLLTWQVSSWSLRTYTGALTTPPSSTSTCAVVRGTWLAAGTAPCTILSTNTSSHRTQQQGQQGQGGSADAGMHPVAHSIQHAHQPMRCTCCPACRQCGCG